MLYKEVCLENYTNLPQAILNGANRIELCDNLAVGGTTVSKGVMGEAIKYTHEKNIPLVILVRARGGNFVYNDIELKIMEADILEAQAVGADAVCIGALTADDQIDYEAMETLIAAAGGMELVFNMAFDQLSLPAQKEAIDWAVEQGFSRILTHGGSSDTPIEGNFEHLKELIAYADGRITILPGGKITAQNAQAVADALNVKAVHGTKIL
ncbi:copper homeostasis protein CutC [Ligilactobacillus apodemi]|uniref:PF03932 family protein CutC n=1 Tax=Ligilactobacillus apodemi DSM 16634 = JCM 16172 TaxID=1423724 RepID=A0A0R1TQR9_9LACO|nr:copper homeostasis protein CutC [Ligilactobacillus apodemi]KRL83545.1 copper homeostasis protein [Ligilactobacillus apodemi DSM 16634 = JCM 16172]MCR1900397.1 copper homeostasis protein CutC [Ligilactobacillus apodemi]